LKSVCRAQKNSRSCKDGRRVCREKVKSLMQGVKDKKKNIDERDRRATLSGQNGTVGKSQDFTGRKFYMLDQSTGTEVGGKA